MSRFDENRDSFRYRSLNAHILPTYAGTSKVKSLPAPKSSWGQGERDPGNEVAKVPPRVPACGGKNKLLMCLLS